MKKVIAMVVTLSVIGIISGGVLSQIDNWAKPLIEANRKAATERAIYLVQPNGKSYEKIEKAPLEIYKVFDENKNLTGYAIVNSGNGYGGEIRLMAGLSKDLDKITAIEILELSETPGLGTKVTEAPYKDQYKGLSTQPEVEYIKGSPPTKPNEIQTITGATISSKAVVAIINDGLNKVRSIELGGDSK